MDIFFEIHKNLPREAPGDNISTRKAFNLLKNLPKNPYILDVGCGPGMQTIELAKLIGGKILALDTHQPFLDELNRRAIKKGVESKINTINQSMHLMDFESEMFDVIWSEGAIYIYGFEKALKDWHKFLKKRGYIVVSEVSWLNQNPPSELLNFWEKAYPAIKTIDQNLKIIAKNHYKLIGNFPIPESSWWDNYYVPLGKRISILRKKYLNNKDIQKKLDEELEEIKIFKNYSKFYSYVFYVMQNINKPILS